MDTIVKLLYILMGFFVGMIFGWEQCKQYLKIEQAEKDMEEEDGKVDKESNR